MEAHELVRSLAGSATVREITTGGNRVFRVIEEQGTGTVVKVYASPARERRERHALEALAGLPGVPAILDRGLTDALAWIRLPDGGAWNLATLPENHAVARQAGTILRAVHDASSAEISNLEGGIDGSWVVSHYAATIERLGRFRRRLGLAASLLTRAAQAEPPPCSAPRPGHTRPRPSKFLVNQDGEVLLIDWEWATLAPPEWDISLAIWRLASEVGKGAADALHAGYGPQMPDHLLRPWVAYHAAMMMLDAAERRDGRLADLAPLAAAMEAALEREIHH